MLKYYDDIPLEKVTDIGEYIGDEPALFGESALLFVRADGKVLAQFDNPLLVLDGEFVGETWHEFDRSDFMTDDDFRKPPPPPWVVGLALIMIAGALGLVVWTAT